MPRNLRNEFAVNDEFYTPKILVNILEPYIKLWHNIFIKQNKREPIFWCPFDTKNSEYCLFLKEHNYKYVYSHILTGKDFFEYTPEFDIAVSNPPFSQKIKVFEKLFLLKKPFIMLMNIMAINYHVIGELFIDKNIQLLIPDKKITFNGRTSSFNSGYVCKGFLPRDLIFCHIDRVNTGKRFIPSRMNKDL